VPPFRSTTNEFNILYTTRQCCVLKKAA